MPIDPVRRGRVDQLLPQLGVLDRLPVRRLPAVRAPFVDPARDPVAEILAVGVQLDPAGALQGLQPADRGGQLHAVVGGQRLAAGQFLLLAAHAQQHSPSAGAGVAAARAVGEQLNVRKLRQAAARAEA